MATSPLLTTKLHVPPMRPNHVARPRLIARLNDALTRPVTVISAPPGFGKTTVVTEWLGQQPLPVAWYSLDERDNDLSRFLAYLVAALAAVHVKVGGPGLSRLLSRRRPSLESVMTVLNNDIAAAAHEFILVLDDYHLIELQEVHRAMEFLVDQLPPPMHLVVVTRADPPFPLTRLRARGQLLELRVPDLRFSPAEAAAFLNDRMGLNLSAAQVAALDARAEGWIAGLQLAALSMQGRPDVAGFVEAFTGSHHFVLDYLAEEVLQRQTTEVQTFLLQTSILDQMNAALADAVTGRTDSLTLLAQLEKANLFLIPLDDARQWYRYHHLFDDLLQSRLQQTYPGQELELHRKASAWYEQNGYVNEAIDHALDASDFERAAQLIESAGLMLMMRSEDTTILHWIEKLPDDLVWSHHFLNLLYASALMSVGKIELAGARLARVDDSQLDPLARALAAMLRVFFGMGQTSLGQLIESMQAILDSKPSAVSPVAPQGPSEALVALYFVVLIAYLQVAAGKLRAAAASCRRGLEIANSLSLASPWEIVVGFIQIVLADVLYEWNELDAAAQIAGKGLEISRAERNEEFESYGLVEMAQIKAVQGDLAGALDAAQQALRLTRKRNVTFEIGYVVAKQVRALVALNRIDEAARLSNEIETPWERVPGTPDDQAANGLPQPFTFFAHAIAATRPRVLIAQGEHDRAAQLLRPICEQAQADSESGTLIEALALLSLAQRGQGEKAQSAETLRRALALAEPEGYVRTFLDAGEEMRAQISEFRLQTKEGTADERIAAYADKLLAAFGAGPGAESALSDQPAVVPNVKSQSLAEPLSEREQSVLKLIDQGLSNQEVADRLVVAVSTVKTHINNIYGKLGVANRTQALARARDLGLL